MLGGRRRVTPASNQPDYYSERLNASLDVYNAEPSVPINSTDYSRSPITSNYRVPSTNPKSRAFFKSGKWRLDGLINAWSWGAVDQGALTTSLPYGGGMDGTVRSTMFQRTLVQLHDWQLNRKWYIAFNGTGGGMFTNSRPERYQYPSFRVPQINTMVTGPGPNSTRMTPRPRYTAVQRIQKYTAVPRYYNTTSRVNNKPTGSSSNLNGPGV